MSTAAVSAPRVDPGAFAQKQKDARDRAQVLKQEREDAIGKDKDGKDATFKPLSFTKKHKPDGYKDKKPSAEQLQKNKLALLARQMNTCDVMEMPLCGTLSRLGFAKGDQENSMNGVPMGGGMSGGGLVEHIHAKAFSQPKKPVLHAADSLGVAMTGKDAPKSPLKAKQASAIIQRPEFNANTTAKSYAAPVSVPAPTVVAVPSSSTTTAGGYSVAPGPRVPVKAAVLIEFDDVKTPAASASNKTKTTGPATGARARFEARLQSRLGADAGEVEGECASVPAETKTAAKPWNKVTGKPWKNKRVVVASVSAAADEGKQEQAQSQEEEEKHVAPVVLVSPTHRQMIEKTASPPVAPLAPVADEIVQVVAARRPRRVSQAQVEDNFQRTLRAATPDGDTEKADPSFGYSLMSVGMESNHNTPAKVRGVGGDSAVKLSGTPGSRNRVRSTPLKASSPAMNVDAAGVTPSKIPQISPSHGATYSDGSGSSSGIAMSSEKSEREREMSLKLKAHGTPSHIPHMAEMPAEEEKEETVCRSHADADLMAEAVQIENEMSALPLPRAAFSPLQSQAHVGVDPFMPSSSSKSPSNAKARLTLLKGRMRRTASRDSLGVASRGTSSGTGTAGDDAENANMNISASEVGGALSVMDSNGNLVLNGEYSGPGALAAPRTAPVLRGGRRAVLGLGSMKRDYSRERLEGSGGVTNNNDEIDPLTGEFYNAPARAPTITPTSAEKLLAPALGLAGARRRRSLQNQQQAAILAASPAPAPVPVSVVTAGLGHTTHLQSGKSEYLVSFENADQMAGAFPSNGSISANDPETAEATVCCPTCSRNFNKKAGERHIAICTSVFIEKPKNVFDGSKMRINGIAELAPEVKELAARQAAKEKQEKKKGKRDESTGTSIVASSIDTTNTSATNASKKSSKWKSESNALRLAMSAAKPKNQSDSNSDDSPSGSQHGDTNVVVESAARHEDDGLQPCPHCSRRFNAKAADRHIPQCQDIRAQPKSLKKRSGMAAVSKALPTKTTKLVGRII